MSVVGHQDFWVVGSRLYFKRDDIAGVDQPWMDLGVIETANPTFEIEKLTLQDADGGLKRVVDESIAAIDETYEVETANINMENLSMMFMADRPESFVQTSADKVVAHTVTVGYLVKLHDDDTDSSLLFSCSSIQGVTNGGSLTEVTTLDTITKATRTFVFSGVDLTTPLATGEVFIVHEDGLTDVLNAKSYTVVSSSFSVDTTVIVEQTPNSDETGLAASSRVSHINAGVIYDPTDDWELVSLDRGLIRIVDGGAIVTGSVTIIFSTGALTGLRLFNPQEQQDEVKGLMVIIWGRDINSRQTAREVRVSITPSASALSADDYSKMTFTIRVLNDLTSNEPAGRVLHFKGDVTAKS